jgi:hypothetical protein
MASGVENGVEEWTLASLVENALIWDEPAQTSMKRPFVGDRK